MAKDIKAISFTSGIEIEAASAESTGPRKFNSVIYTGGPLVVAGYELPVVVDLSTLKTSKVLVANLDHDQTKRVGNFQVQNDGKQLMASGQASAATPSRDEVINSADAGYQWQSSVEASPGKKDTIKAGEIVTVNGQVHKGPLIVARNYTLKGFAFVSHGADDNTTVTIAASSANLKGNDMKPEVKAWAESMGIDVDNATPDTIANIEANYAGRNQPKQVKNKVTDVFAAAKEEDERREKIADICAQAIADNPRRDGEFIQRLEAMATQAIEAKWTAEKFDTEVLRASRPISQPSFNIGRSKDRITDTVIQAALCQAAGLGGIEKRFDDQTLQAAHTAFPNGISLRQVFLLCAQSNGFNTNTGGDVTLDVQRAAFGMNGKRDIQASSFSTLSIPNILSATANKFLLQGWMSVDQTWSRISAKKSVRDFKTVTSYSLNGGFEYDKVGPGGELKHGTVGETSYTNKAETYGKMFAITRTDIINDDLSALTSVPQRLGRGAALKLNSVFWTAFLDNSSFFTSGNLNVSTGGSSALGTADGAAINAAEVKFMQQTDPDNNPLGIMPKIMLVPPTLMNTAARWMGSQLMVGSTALGDGNVYSGRYRVETSPYMENSSFTGYSTAAWYLLADPQDLAVIEVCFLNGRDVPVVETASADFDVLGVQMRGYHDFGVTKQEYRAGVRSAGS